MGTDEQIQQNARRAAEMFLVSIGVDAPEYYDLLAKQIIRCALTQHRVVNGETEHQAGYRRGLEVAQLLYAQLHPEAHCKIALIGDLCGCFACRIDAHHAEPPA